MDALEMPFHTFPFIAGTIPTALSRQLPSKARLKVHGHLGSGFGHKSFVRRESIEMVTREGCEASSANIA
jgi:hypothetical protein